LLPITDLLQGVTSVIPGPQTLITGAPEVGNELKKAGERAAGVGVGVDTATSLPGATQGLVEDLGGAAQSGRSDDATDTSSSNDK
jgi:hypothetical protein